MKKFRKVIGIIMICSLLCFMNNVSVFAAETTTVNKEETSAISIKKIDTSGTIRLSGYDYFDESFTMKGFLGTGSTHNAFNVKISDITFGSCTVNITGSNGYSWSSSTITSDTTITTTNCKSDVTYTITIMAGSNGCIGEYAITSYIE